MVCFGNFQLLLQIKLLNILMAKKKNTNTNKSLSEVVGFKHIFQNDIINFIV